MGIKRLEELFPRDFFETDLIGLSEKEKIDMKTIEISKDTEDLKKMLIIKLVKMIILLI